MFTPKSFVVQRWRGDVALARLIGRDMLVVGSLVNLGASFLALMLVAQGAPAMLAVTAHFAPLPYNLFLFAALWRHPRRTAIATLVGGVWLALATVL